jgi:hypothetical protein
MLFKARSRKHTRIKVEYISRLFRSKVQQNRSKTSVSGFKTDTKSMVEFLDSRN